MVDPGAEAFFFDTTLIPLAAAAHCHRQRMQRDLALLPLLPGGAHHVAARAFANRLAGNRSVADNTAIALETVQLLTLIARPSKNILLALSAVHLCGAVMESGSIKFAFTASAE